MFKSAASIAVPTWNDAVKCAAQWHRETDLTILIRKSITADRNAAEELDRGLGRDVNFICEPFVAAVIANGGESRAIAVHGQFGLETEQYNTDPTTGQYTEGGC